VIIDSGFINALLKATDKAVPEGEDSSVKVPNILLPVHDPILPLAALLDNTTAPNLSVFSASQINKANPDAASSQLVATLGGGLWTIDCHAVSLVIGVAAATHRAWCLYLFYQGVLQPVLYDQTASGGTRSFVQNRKLKFLFREQAALTLAWNAPAAGERFMVDVSIFATKHL